MNERINQLRLEAGISRLHDEPKFMVAVSKEGTVIEPLDGLEKFAELIVRECISIVEEQKECLHEEQKYWHDRDYGYEMAVNDASKGIKQFFGVEE